MLRKQTFWMAIILGCAIVSGASRTSAQDAGGAKGPRTDNAAEGTSKAQPEGKALEEYRLDFSINELEDGKKINSRQYSTNVTGDDGEDIKIGTRVPVEAKEGTFEYLDVGTSIFAQVRSYRGGPNYLVVKADFSNFAVPDLSQDKRESHPLVRQLKIGGSLPLPSTKTTTIWTADDPNSKRQFQLEVTVTKLR
jgi:hypothetical protein